MKTVGTAWARWLSQVRAVHASSGMQAWLASSGSLTRKLMAHSRRFRVLRLSQQRAMCLSDEYQALQLPRAAKVQEREVLLLCDGEPVVFAHTVVPLAATASDWPFFSGLGERSLGSTLFGDPRVQRDELEFARLCASHPLARRARMALQRCRDEAGSADDAKQLAAATTLYARRCLYRRKNGLLLVTEVFLPSVLALRPQR